MISEQFVHAMMEKLIFNYDYLTFTLYCNNDFLFKPVFSEDIEMSDWSYNKDALFCKKQIVFSNSNKAVKIDGWILSTPDYVVSENQYSKTMIIGVDTTLSIDCIKIEIS